MPYYSRNPISFTHTCTLCNRVLKGSTRRILEGVIRTHLKIYHESQFKATGDSKKITVNRVGDSK